MELKERNAELGRILSEYRDKMQEIACLDNRASHLVDTLRSVAGHIEKRYLDFITEESLAALVDVSNTIESIRKAETERQILREHLDKAGYSHLLK